MPLQALAKSNCGRFGSTRMENISESSIRPLEIECQVAPPSAVFQGRCGVPAYRMLVLAGSKARAVISCISGSFAREIPRQETPRSMEIKTPLDVPAARVQ